jgi:hypothetical protein
MRVALDLTPAELTALVDWRRPRRLTADRDWFDGR